MMKGSVLNNCQNVLLSKKILQLFFNHDRKICSGCFKSSCPQQNFRTLLLFNHNHKICLKMLSKCLAFFAMVMWVAQSSTAVVIIKLVFFWWCLPYIPVKSCLPLPKQLLDDVGGQPADKAWSDLAPSSVSNSLKMVVALSSTVVIIIKSVFLAMASLLPLAHFVSPSRSDSLKMWVAPSSTAIIKSVWDCNTSQKVKKCWR